MIRRIAPLFLFLAACGGSSTRTATAEGLDAMDRVVFSGCLSPDGTTLVLTGGSGVAAIRVADGETRFVASAGRVVYCDAEGIVAAKRGRGGDDVTLEIQVLDYETGRPRWPAKTIDLPACASMGGIFFEPGPTEFSVGLSWHVISSWGGGYPPSPEEEAESHCDERGAVSIERDDGRLRTSRHIDWQVPEGHSARQDSLTTTAGIEIVEDINTIEPCNPNQQQPVVSTISGRRDGEILWTRSVPSPQSGPDCVP